MLNKNSIEDCLLVSSTISKNLKRKRTPSKSYVKTLLLLASFLCFHFVGWTQIKISGTILDEESSVSIPGVSVQVMGTQQGTITDMEGKFSLEVPSKESVLRFSFIGYQTMDIPVNDQVSFNIKLKSDLKVLDEFVIVGYGQKQKSLLTGAISSLEPKEVQNLGYAQSQEAIQGRTAGVNITQQSGSPGGAVKVRIRGTGSNGDSDPLYIVDGMRTKDISFLDPNSIGSMEVLKDAASASIYGAEGANGVIIISTKSGGDVITNKNTLITYDAQFGIQSPNNRLKLMNSQQHSQYTQEAGVGRDSSVNVAGLPTTNWLDEIYENATQTRHSISFAGSKNKTNYYLQGSYFDQNGLIGGNNSQYNRYNIRSNVSKDMNRWLKLSTNLVYSHSQKTGITENDEFGGVISNAILMDPATPVKYTGALPDFAQSLLNDGKSLLQDGSGNYYGLSEYVNGEIFNPVAGVEQLTKGQGEKTNVFFGTFQGDAKINKHITATSRLGLDATYANYHRWTPSYYFTLTRDNPSAIVEQADYTTENWLWENYVNYTNTFGKHDVNVLGGTSAYSNTYTEMIVIGTGLTFENEDFAWINGVNPGNTNTAASGFQTKETLSSYFGRASYGYDKKYLVDFTLRADGSSMLADGNKWGYFPAASAAWVISNEDFYGSETFNFLKLRASWGQNGSLSTLEPGKWNSAISFGNAYPDASGNLLVTAEPNILSNPNLTWETSEQTNIGFDFGILENKITGSVDYFNKVTRDFIALAVVPDAVGNNAPFDNVGDVSNRGLELELTYKNQFGDLKVTASANTTFIRNEVTRLKGREDGDEITGADVGTGWIGTASQVGNPLWYFRGYETDGIINDQAELDEYVANYSGYTPNLGDAKVVDVNGDGMITSADQTMIGNPHPDVMAGLRIGLEYKGFDFAMFAQGTFGNDILMGYNRIDRATTNKPEFFYTDRWTEDNPDADWFGANTSSAFAYNSDFMVFDGSFVRIKQLQLGYTLPTTITDRIKLTSVRFYVSAENMFTFTKYPGIDPEVAAFDDNSIGIDRGTYSVPRRVLFGATISL